MSVKLRLVVTIFFFLIPCVVINAQDVKVIKLNALEELLKPHNDTTYVINFWATWCKPCVNELPVFNEAHTYFKNQKVKVILVSLDFKKDLQKRLKPFLKKNPMLPNVFLLDEIDYNAWIDKVDSTWGGAIPATIIFNNNNKLFLEKELTFNELKTHIIKSIH